MKRRWPLFLCLLCWLLILLVPSLRQMFWIQISGQSNFQNGWRGLYDVTWQEDFEESLKRNDLPSRFPNDVHILAVQAGEVYWREKALRYGRAFDPLIRRFPEHSWLIAWRLQDASAQMRPERLAGELSDPDFESNKAAGIASPERDKKNLNFTQAELEEAIALARLGQKREPDNGFFDWMETCFLLMAWRDEEAWRALSRGSRKPKFDNHTRQWMLAHLTAWEAYLNRPLLWEEKNLLRYGPLDNSGNSILRERARIIAWEAIKAKRRGQHDKSLQIRSDLLRLMEKASRQSYAQVDQVIFQVASRFAFVDFRSDAINKKIRAISEDDPHLNEKRLRLRLPGYTAYATAQGRPDLAREMTQLFLQGPKRQDAIRQIYRKPDLYDGMKVRPLIWSTILWSSAAMLLLILSLLIAWWLLLGGISKWARVPEVALEKRTIIWPTVLTIAAVALCWVLAFHYGAIWHTLLYLNYMKWKEPFEDFGTVLHGFLAFSLMLPGVMATIFCQLWTRHPKATLEQENFSWREKARRKLSEVRLSSLLLDVFLGMLLGSAALWWGASLETYWGAPWIAQAAFCVALFLLWLRWIFGVPLHEKPIMARRLRLLHSTLGALLVTGSVAYCVLLIISVPLRVRADEQMNKLIQKGEVALMLENYRAMSEAS